MSSGVVLDLQNLYSYIQFAKYRKQIDNNLIKIIIEFYNQLLSFCDIKSVKENIFIQNELNNINLDKTVEFVDTLTKNASEQKIADNIELLKSIPYNIVSIMEMTNMFINVYTKLYLSTIMSKNIYLNTKNIDISPQLRNLLKEFKINKNNQNNKNNSIFNKNTNINQVNNRIRDINTFYNTINKLYSDTNSKLSDIITTKFTVSIQQNKLDKFKDVLTKNLKNESDDTKKNLDDLNKFLKSNPNKKNLYKIITTYLNFINSFYKFVLTNFEWYYFIV